jgi:hydrogenase nickel incorporation protein HypA/HybF
MHEAALVRGLVERAAEAARRAGAARVSRVHGWIADAEALSAETLRLHFANAARGTPLEGAELCVRIEEVRARCTGCGEVYPPEHGLTLCPACGGTAAELLGRPGMGIDELEVSPPSADTERRPEDRR